MRNNFFRIFFRQFSVGLFIDAFNAICFAFRLNFKHLCKNVCAGAFIYCNKPDFRQIFFANTLTFRAIYQSIIYLTVKLTVDFNGRSL